jgi:hypothetical protein
MIILVVLASLISIAESHSLKFFFNVPSVSMKCLGEYLSDNTVGTNITFYNYL